MDVLTIDFETYYDKDYSLGDKDTATWDYITDPRFEVIGVSVKVNNAPAQSFTGSFIETHAFLTQFDWAESAALCHHAAFDLAVLKWRFGITPKARMCTWSMCNALHGTEGSVSLAKMSEKYGVGVKGTERESAIGKRRADFTPEQLNNYMAYCRQDSDLTYGLFIRLMQEGFPVKELRVIDWTIGCYSSPSLVLDKELLTTELMNARRRKAAAWKSVGLADPAPLRKDNVLADMLRQFGVEPPIKTTEKGNQKYAFSKSDIEFLELREHPDDRVGALVDARLESSSSIEETRLNALLRISERMRNLPFPLTYFGASTGRWSGWDNINCMTPGHEVLTPVGWVDVSEYAGQPIMQWWPDGSLSYDTSGIMVEKDFDGELVCADARFVKGEFTPEHRFMCKRGEQPKDYTALDVYGLSGLDNMVASGKYGDGKSKLTPEQARFVVAVCADGSLSTTRRLSFGFKRQRKIDRIKDLADACDLRLREVPGEVTHFYLNDAPEWVVKYFGTWVLSLAPDTAGALLDELQYWDGHVHDKSGAVMVYTTRKDQAEWLSTLGAIHGRPATVYEYQANTGSGHVYHVHFGTSKSTSVDNKHLSLKQYSGKVYCPSVASSYILVRFNGAIHVTGQCQNLPKKGRIRECITVPPGKVLIAADLSQIELRVLSWVAGQIDVLETLRNGGDVYSDMATDIYGRPINKRDNPTERFIGKGVVLGGGFAAGAAKVASVILADAKRQGIVLPDTSDQFFRSVVSAYRRKNRAVSAFWNICRSAIERMAVGGSGVFDSRRLVTFNGPSVSLPRGIPMKYPDLRQIVDKEGRLSYSYNRYNVKRRKAAEVNMWHGLMTENIVQALARDIFAHGLLNCIDSGYPPCGAVHDELLFVVDESDSEAAVAAITKAMCTPPEWASDLPLDCEINCGKNYAEVK